MSTTARDWDQRLDLTLSIVMWITFALSVFFSALSRGTTPPVALAALFTGCYVITMQSFPRRLRSRPEIGEVLAVVGVLVCLVSISLTGGITSVYVLFLVAPALYAGAFLGTRVGVETAFLAAAGLTVVVVSLGQSFADGRLVQAIALFVLIAITLSHGRRILLAEKLASSELLASTDAKLKRMETAHGLLQSLTRLAGTSGLNPVTVGQAALRDLAIEVPFEAGQVVLDGSGGEEKVVVATRGVLPEDEEATMYRIRVGDRSLGQLRLWSTDPKQLEEWRESIAVALRPVGLALESSRMLQQIASQAVRGERTRIARELHDDIGPSLASLGLSLDMALSQFEVGNDLATHLYTTRTYVSTLIDTVRDSAQHLRSDDTTSIVERAHQLASDLDGDSPAVTIEIAERRPPRGTVASEVNAILTEAVRNASSHSQARTIKVSGFIDRDEGSLTIRDDGIGFRPDEEHPGHFGLVGMKERARSIGGKLTVDSGTQRGSTIVLKWGEDG